MACCKPQIRRSIFKEWSKDILNSSAEVWVAGIKRDENKTPYIVYLAQITQVMLLEEYYQDGTQYSGRFDCKYRNVKTIYRDGRLPISLKPEEIMEQCPNIKTKRGNQHGDVCSGALSGEQCKDIHGTAVLLSDRFVHCSRYPKDIKGLTKALYPALGNLLKRYENPCCRTFHGYSSWETFDDIITGISFGMNEKVKPVDGNCDVKKCNC